MDNLPELIILDLTDAVRTFANHPKIADKNFGFTSEVVDNIINCFNFRNNAQASVEVYAKEIGYRAGGRGDTWVSLEPQILWLATKIMGEIIRLGLYDKTGRLMYEPREMDERTLPDEVMLTRRGLREFT